MGTRQRCKLTLSTRSPSISFYTLWPCDLVFWPFDLILIGGRGLEMNYLCDKFGDYSFIGSIVRTNTDTRTQSHTDAAKRFTPVTSSAWVIINANKTYSETYYQIPQSAAIILCYIIKLAFGRYSYIAFRKLTVLLSEYNADWFGIFGQQ